MAENVRRFGTQPLDLAKNPSTQEVAAQVAAMFRASGLEAHVEENPIPATGGEVQDAVVAELRGREKPEEWVLVETNLELGRMDLELDRISWFTMSCNAALVVEAARDIQAAGIKARRSIRFVILMSSENYNDYLRVGSWPYVRAHRDELERARAAIDFYGGANRIAVYNLGGRHDIEAGLREAIKTLDSWKIGFPIDGSNKDYGDQFDFVLEGVPSIAAIGPPDFSTQLNQVEIQELKRNTAMAAVTAFGIAERAEPIGPRQSREQVEILLKSSNGEGPGATRLDEQMKADGIWPLWESGQRGRQP